MPSCIDDIRATLIEGLSLLGIELDGKIIDRMIDYFTLLLKANESVNLISPRQDLRTQTVVHLVDSLSLLLIDNLPHGISALDFGSGGGLPAIPLSLALSDWKYTLIESTGKKAAFLSLVKNELAMDNVTVCNIFLESGRNPEKITYDLVTARAVSDVAKLASIAGPRLNKGGFFIAFKGPQGCVELNRAAGELRKWKLILREQRDFVLPLVDAHRSLFIFEKL